MTTASALRLETEADAFDLALFRLIERAAEKGKDRSDAKRGIWERIATDLKMVRPLVRAQMSDAARLRTSR